MYNMHHKLSQGTEEACQLVGKQRHSIVYILRAILCLGKYKQNMRVIICMFVFVCGFLVIRARST